MLTVTILMPMRNSFTVDVEGSPWKILASVCTPPFDLCGVEHETNDQTVFLFIGSSYMGTPQLVLLVVVPQYRSE